MATIPTLTALFLYLGPILYVPGYNGLVPNHCYPQYLPIKEYCGQQRPGNKARLAKQANVNWKQGELRSLRTKPNNT